MIAQVRAAHPSISIGGKDYFSQLAPYFITMTYVDNCDGEKADDFTLTLADRDKRFISDWMPDMGAYIDVSIIAERWFAPNATALSLDCGRFWIDTVEFKLPEQNVEIKATSIPTAINIKESKETRGWEKTSLRDVANQIAGENGMSIDWEADHNPRYSRVEQVEESSLAFLKKRAEDAKIAIKVCRNKIIFYDEEKLESAGAKFTILYGNTMFGGVGAAVSAFAGGGTVYRMSGGQFVTKLIDAAKKAIVSHTSLQTGKTSNDEFETSDPDVAGKWSDHHSEGTDSETEEGEDGENGNGGDGGGRAADSDIVSGWSEHGDGLVAKAKVRKKNKEKDKCKIELSIGNPLVAAGMTCNLSGVGQFDGQWFIESAEHKLGPDYKTELTIRRCLEGY